MRIKEGVIGELRSLFVVSGHWMTDHTTDISQIVMIAAESNSSPLYSEPDNVSTTP